MVYSIRFSVLESPKANCLSEERSQRFALDLVLVNTFLSRLWNSAIIPLISSERYAIIIGLSASGRSSIRMIGLPAKEKASSMPSPFSSNNEDALTGKEEHSSRLLFATSK